jgi:plastocyanin
MSEDVYGRGSLRAGRPGLLFGLLIALGGLACARDGDPPRNVVELEEGQVQLPDGSSRHDVLLEGVGAQGEVTPASVQARPGDAIAFSVGDAITHSIAFRADRLDSAQVAFLETSGQMRGPPLLTEGSSWVVTLVGAPAGDYAFACTLHGGTGVIRVRHGD